ncbi:ricin-type beta-trefoil lectin domain protein [Streptomyces sp. NPDC015171]|uniref:RICIN domain-containing protein n=1 Tax=Streptomyces sp. NPDC015171 TaxID=3364945 RepID=UPI0036F5EE3B
MGIWRNAAVTEAGPSDERLSAELMKWTGASSALHPVGELLDRHWAAALAYARLCTDGPRAAGMLTTAAFTRLFGASLRQSGPTAAWRPHVLAAVRRIAAEWDTDDRRELLHPDLLSGSGTGERAAARLLPPPERRLLSRAFQRVPETSRAVLWHTEVEGEPLAVPAALLGLDEEDARVELRRARERLREECLQAHRELAPGNECHHYLRMLDVTFRRGGTDIDPDLRRHLAGCAHCGRTADQLARFDRGLGLALAEAVLGWGARGYLESRTAAGEPPAEPAPPAAAVAGEAFASGACAAPGAAIPASGTAVTRRSALRAARRTRRRHLALAAGTVSALVVLPLVLWSALSSDGAPVPGAARQPARTPGANTPSPGASWAGSNAAAQGALRGRLRNLTSGLCVGVVGERTAKDAETELTACSAAETQQWTYETDGLLRSGADPGLCLDSHLGYSVRLAPCTAAGTAARDIHYDFTLQGALVPRWNQGLALTPAATDGSGALVLKTRTAGTAQRWTIDTAHADLRMENVNWGADSTLAPASAAPRTVPPPATPTPSGTPETSPEAGTGPTPAPSSPAPSPTATVTPGPCAAYPGYCGGDRGGRTGGGGRRHR